MYHQSVAVIPLTEQTSAPCHVWSAKRFFTLMVNMGISAGVQYHVGERVLFCLFVLACLALYYIKTAIVRPLLKKPSLEQEVIMLVAHRPEFDPPYAYISMELSISHEDGHELSRKTICE